MQFSFFVTNRDDFIGFAHAIGEAIRDRATKEQTMIVLGGKANSGKALIPFGIDMAFHPENYPGATVPLSASAEKAFSREFNKNSLIVFENRTREIFLSTETFDKALRGYKAKTPEAKVLCYANIERALAGEYDYSSKGFASDELDLSIRVYNKDQDEYASPMTNFNRKVVVDVPETSPFAEVLEQLAHDKRFQETEEHALAELTFSVQRDQLKVLRWVK